MNRTIHVGWVYPDLENHPLDDHENKPKG